MEPLADLASDGSLVAADLLLLANLASEQVEVVLRVIRIGLVVGLHTVLSSDGASEAALADGGSEVGIERGGLSGEDFGGGGGVLEAVRGLRGLGE